MTRPAARDAAYLAPDPFALVVAGLVLDRAPVRPALAWVVEHAPDGDVAAAVARLWRGPGRRVQCRRLVLARLRDADLHHGPGEILAPLYCPVCWSGVIDDGCAACFDLVTAQATPAELARVVALVVAALAPPPSLASGASP